MSQENINYNTVTTMRVALALNGLGLVPEPSKTILAVMAMSFDQPVEGKDPESYNWELYELIPQNPNPLRRLLLEAWLVSAVIALTGDPAYPFQNIDPTEWFEGLKDTLNQFPTEFNTPEVQALADHILQLVDGKNWDPVRLATQEKIAAEAQLERPVGNAPRDEFIAKVASSEPGEV